MRVLVTYTSERGSTARIAAWVADTLEREGLTVDLLPCTEAEQVAGYEAAVVGSPLLTGRWHPKVRRFLRRNTIALRPMPVWLFDSAPHEDLPEIPTLPRVDDAEEAMARTDAISHVTFGGSLPRERDAVRGWARGIAQSLRTRGLAAS